MKKIAMILALCLMLCLTVSACGGKETNTPASSPASASNDAPDDAPADASADSNVDITGTWTLTTIIDAEGKEYTLAEYCAANNVDSAGIEATYTFNADGSGVAEIGGIGTDITYTVEGNLVNFTVTANQQTTALTYEDGSLIAEDAASGMKSILTK